MYSTPGSNTAVPCTIAPAPPPPPCLIAPDPPPPTTSTLTAVLFWNVILPCPAARVNL